MSKLDAQVAVRPNEKDSAVEGVPTKELCAHEEDDDFVISPGGASSSEIIGEEGVSANARELSSTPTAKEVEEHAITHIPFRSWCKHCVKGRAVNYGHYVSADKEDQSVPVISLSLIHISEPTRPY